MRKKTIAKIKDIINQTVKYKYWGNRLAMPYTESGHGDVTWDMIGGNPSDSNSLISYLNLNYYTKVFITNNFYSQEYLDEQFIDIYNKLTFPTEQGSVHLGYNASGNMYGEIDNEILNKINNSLQIPQSTPTEFELVGIDTSKNQVRTKLGDGLEFDTTTKEIKVTTSFTQVQSDWNQSDTSAVDYIKNKPTIPEQPHLYRHHIVIDYNHSARIARYTIDTTDLEPITTYEQFVDLFNVSETTDVYYFDKGIMEGTTTGDIFYLPFYKLQYYVVRPGFGSWEIISVSPDGSTTPALILKEDQSPVVYTDTVEQIF